jgi:hypothetical protein
VIRHVLRSTTTAADSKLVESFWVGKPSDGLGVRVRQVLARQACDLLFVHRDAEKATPEERLAEITSAAPSAGPPIVPIVPVHMSEAWLLIDVAAIRRASGNPNGTVPLALPPLRGLEGASDPKQLLTELLIRASEKSGRALAKFRDKGELSARRTRVADLVQDFGVLSALPAFRAFAERTAVAIRQTTSVG